MTSPVATHPIETHLFLRVEGKNGRRGIPLTLYGQKRDGERLLALEAGASRLLTRLAADAADAAAEAGRQWLDRRAGELACIYDVQPVPLGNGRWAPEISLNLDRAAPHISRVRYVVWEAGGRRPTGVGSAQIVTNDQGARLLPAIVRKRGTLANGRHAAFSIYPETDFVLIQAFVTPESECVRIGAVRWPQGQPVPTVEPLWEGDDWRDVPEPWFEAASVAIDKAMTANCREPMFVSSRPGERRRQKANAA